MENNIIKEIDETTAELLKTVDSFTQEEFDKVPFEGSWTAAQVAEHVLKSESGIPVTWLGNAEPTKRKPDENVGIIKSTFLDFTTKLKSPDFILPSQNPPAKQVLYDSLKANRAEVKRLASTLDLTQTFTDFSMPQMGHLTGIEYATFLICHSKRHIHQLKNIKEKLI